MPWNALPADEVEEVKMFFQNFTTVNGLPKPAAPRGHNKQAPTYLPCVTTKKQVHAEYGKAGGKVAYSTFCQAMEQRVPGYCHHASKGRCVRNLW